MILVASHPHRCHAGLRRVTQHSPAYLLTTPSLTVVVEKMLSETDMTCSLRTPFRNWRILAMANVIGDYES